LTLITTFSPHYFRKTPFYYLLSPRGRGQKYSNMSVVKAIKATPPVVLISSIMTVSIAFFGLNIVGQNKNPQ